MKRRMFLRNGVAAIVIPWTRVLTPAVCEPEMPKYDLTAKAAEILREIYLPGVLAAIGQKNLFQMRMRLSRGHPDG